MEIHIDVACSTTQNIVSNTVSSGALDAEPLIAGFDLSSSKPVKSDIFDCQWQHKMYLGKTANGI